MVSPKKRYGQARNASHALADRRAGSSAGAPGALMRIGVAASSISVRGSCHGASAPPRAASASASRSTNGLSASGSLPSTRRRSKVSRGESSSCTNASNSARRRSAAVGTPSAAACGSPISEIDVAGAPRCLSSAPGITIAANGRSIAPASGVTITSGSAANAAAGRKLDRSNAASTQPRNSAAFMTACEAPAAQAPAVGASESRWSTASTCWPASSARSVAIEPLAPSAAASAVSQAGNGCRRVVPSGARTADAAAHRRAAAGSSAARESASTCATCPRRHAASSASSAAASSVPALSQSSSASVPASGRAASSSAITTAAARVVESFQPVSSSKCNRWRSSSARTRRTRTRSCAISATGTSPRCTCVSTCAAALWASCSKPSQTAKAGRQVAGRSANGSSSAASVSITRVGTAAPASTREVSASAPPACTAIHAAGGGALNRRSVAGAGARLAHSSATRPSSRSLAPGPVNGVKSSRAAAQCAARVDGGSAAAARTSSCAVVTSADTACSKPRASRRAQAAPQFCERSNAAALRASSVGSKLTCPVCTGGDGPRLAASVWVVSMRGIQPPARAKARRASGSNCANGTSTTASRRETSWSSAQAAMRDAIVAQRCPSPAAFSTVGRTIVVIGKKRAAERPVPGESRAVVSESLCLVTPSERCRQKDDP